MFLEEDTAEPKPKLIVMRPHPKEFDRFDIRQDLLDQSVLDVDSPGTGP